MERQRDLNRYTHNVQGWRDITLTPTQGGLLPWDFLYGVMCGGNDSRGYHQLVVTLLYIYILTLVYMLYRERKNRVIVDGR